MSVFKKKERQRQPVQPQPGQNQVFSYHSTTNRDAMQMSAAATRSRPVERRRRINWRHLPGLLALIAICASVVYLLSLSTTPRIQALDSQTNNQLLRHSEVYNKRASDLLKASVMNRFKPTVDTGTIEQEMKRVFPELKTVSVILPLMGRQPIIKLGASTPTLLLDTPFGQYIIDESGTIILSPKDPNTVDTSTLPAIRYESTQPIIRGKGFLTTEETAFITSVIAQLKDKSVAIKGIVLPQEPNEIRFEIDKQPYYVRFDMSSDARQSAGTYLATAKYLKEHNITPSSYIDARVEGRVYYK